MADDPEPGAPSGDRKPCPRSEKASVKPATSWVLPVITVAVLASAFCLYYFVYVASQRERPDVDVAGTCDGLDSWQHS